MIGQAAEHIVCADLLLNGIVAHLSFQGCRWDVVAESAGTLYRVQVKSTRGRTLRDRRPSCRYLFELSSSKSKMSCGDQEIVALVALDSRRVAYMSSFELEGDTPGIIRGSVFFRSDMDRGPGFSNSGNRPVDATRFFEDFTDPKRVF